MATQKKQGRGNAQSNKSSSSARSERASGAAPRASSSSSSRSQTGERDESYNLVSVLYHALQSAETMGQYIDDAQKADDDELASFFEEVRRNDVSAAQRARTLLAERIDVELDEEDEDDDTAIDDEGDRVSTAR